MSLQKKFRKDHKVCTVTFQLPKEFANGAKDLKILGDFNAWNLEKAIPMKPKDGIFEASMDLASNKAYQFRYLLDNKFWENDPEADKYEPTPFGVENSVVVVEA